MATDASGVQCDALRTLVGNARAADLVDRARFVRSSADSRRAHPSQRPGASPRARATSSIAISQAALIAIIRPGRQHNIVMPNPESRVRPTTRGGPRCRAVVSTSAHPTDHEEPALTAELDSKHAPSGSDGEPDAKAGDVKL